MKRPSYRRLSHTADIRLVIWGSGYEELCRHAVRGALHVAFGRPPKGTPTQYLAIDDVPAEVTLALVRIVNEALFQLYARGLASTDVRWQRGRLYLGVRPLRPGHLPTTEVKAATLHGLDASQVKGRWRATLTLDL